MRNGCGADVGQGGGTNQAGGERSSKEQQRTPRRAAPQPLLAPPAVGVEEIGGRGAKIRNHRAHPREALKAGSTCAQATDNGRQRRTTIMAAAAVGMPTDRDAARPTCRALAVGSAPHSRPQRIETATTKGGGRQSRYDRHPPQLRTANRGRGHALLMAARYRRPRAVDEAGDHRRGRGYRKNAERP